MTSSKTKNDNHNQDLLLEMMEDKTPLDNEALYYT